MAPSRPSKDTRVNSAPTHYNTLREMLRPLDQKEWSKIKAHAKSGWSEEMERNDRSVTTYGGLHARKILDEATADRVRPSSPYRLNKPHPPNVFLVTRLKRIKGCFDHNAASTARCGGRAHENLEQYVRDNRERLAEAAQRRESVRRPRTADEAYSNEGRRRIMKVMGPIRGQATEAWVKLSNDSDGGAILRQIENEAEEEEQAHQAERLTRRHLRNRISLRSLPATRQTDAVYSPNRWLKRSGYEETTAINKLLEAFKNAPRLEVPREGPHFHITDYSTIFSSSPKHYYDFQIHPEWHTPWHKQYEKPSALHA